MSEMRGAMAPDAQQLANVAAATYNPLFGPPPALAGTGAADPGVQQLATVGQPPPQAADDLDKDPIFGRMLRGETIPPAAAAQRLSVSDPGAAGARGLPAGVQPDGDAPTGDPGSGRRGAAAGGRKRSGDLRRRRSAVLQPANRTQLSR